MASDREASEVTHLGDCGRLPMSKLEKVGDEQPLAKAGSNSPKLALPMPKAEKSRCMSAT